jgi:hypothetical protein
MTAKLPILPASGIQSEDDSPFLSIADFFSLISLTLIYLVITFSPSAPAVDSAIEAVTGTATGTGPASAADTRIAYVAVLSGEDGSLLVRLIPPGASAPDEKQFDLSDTGTDAASHWILSRLARNPEIDRVMFYMNVDDKQIRVHKAFVQLVNRSRKQVTFSVSMIFLEDESPTSSGSVR